MDDNILYTIPRSIKCKMAKDEYISIEILRLLAKDPDPLIRSMVSQNPLLLDEDDTLVSLSLDNDTEVRRGVALNPSVTSKLLIILSKDPDSTVCMAVASHPTTPPSALRDLYLRGWPALKEALATNSNTPFDLLPNLLKDSGPMGEEIIKERLRAGE